MASSTFYSVVFLVFAISSVFPAMAGMIDKKGMKPWEICGLCHSLDGISRMAKFPKLAGQKASYIVKQLRDFKAGYRHNDGGQMSAIVEEVTEEDFPKIADYFASLQIPSMEEMSLSKDDLKVARHLFNRGDGNRNIRPCRECHAQISEQFPDAPELKGQHIAYLEKQLRDFKDDNRTNDRQSIMQKIASNLTDSEIRILAWFVASN